MAYKFSVPKRNQPIFKLFKKVFKPFFYADVEGVTDEIPERAIVVANHSAKKGPMAFEINYPRFNVKWGAHEMLGNYKSRFLYLRNVLYIQKLKKNKFIATLKALFEAVFSIYVYRGMKFIPTYTDIRFRHTVTHSVEVLEAGMTVLVFPEDSSEGYFDELTSAFPGFVMIAERYLKKHGEDVPIIPAYYHKRSKKIVIGKPFYVGELTALGYNREAIAEKAKEEINSLYRTHFKDK